MAENSNSNTAQSNIVPEIHESNLDESEFNYKEYLANTKAVDDILGPVHKSKKLLMVESRSPFSRNSGMTSISKFSQRNSNGKLTWNPSGMVSPRAVPSTTSP